MLKGRVPALTPFFRSDKKILMISKPERRSIKDGLNEGALKRRDFIKLGLTGAAAGADAVDVGAGGGKEVRCGLGRTPLTRLSRFTS